MAPLKAAELHRLARAELGPTLVGLGFRPIPRSAGASWSRPEGGRWLVIWVQPRRSSGSPAGGEFTIEMRLSSTPATGGDGERRRVPALLGEPAREELRRRGRTVAHGPDDTWFRQQGDADARALLAFVARALPAAIDRFVA